MVARWAVAAARPAGGSAVGGTPGGSCHVVIGGSGTSPKPWVAWPPPGPVPIEAITHPGLTSIDTVGWTVQAYGSAWNLNGTTAVVKDNGVDKPVTTTQLLANYGSPYATRINPQGWTSQAGHTSDVSVLRADGGVLFNDQVQPVIGPPVP
ncbi:MAG: hypothetical protein AB1730_20305 [Myxococcota bacterium]